MTDSANNDPRELLKGSAAEPAQAGAQQDPWAAIQMQDDPKAPKGLGPRATPDLRFSMCYFPAVPEGARVMTKFFHGLAQRDLKLMADSLHFPFATWEGCNQVIVNSPEELIAKAPPSLNMSNDPVRFTDHDGYMKEGSYDVFVGMQFVTSDPIQSVLAMTYDRYSKDGKRMLRCDGVYDVTNNDGKWAIQTMSTIFTPSAMVGTVYTDTITNSKRLRINHDLAYQVEDNDGVWGGVRPAVWKPAGTPPAAPSAGAFNGAAPAEPGAPRQAGNNGGGGGVPWQDAPNGNEALMRHFRFKGIKSRIGGPREARPEPTGPGEWVDPVAKIDFVQTLKDVKGAGVGAWGFPIGILPYTKVLHATVDKSHMYSGVTRYNVWGEEISNSVEIGICCYKLGRWSWTGSLGYICNHDRANDIHA